MKSITITIRHRDAAFEPDPLEVMDYPVEFRMRYETDDGKENGYWAQMPNATSRDFLNIAEYVSMLIKDAYRSEADGLE